uniref:Uncharacterized protein n=1 Tax=Rousettus aegyptiacus TaxID=9407 RepID=A0A7J8KBD6_ROUAE|nr:hypothetical protein HJG63_007962 [Rousettus aegyptiacus]
MQVFCPAHLKLKRDKKDPREIFIENWKFLLSKYPSLFLSCFHTTYFSSFKSNFCFFHSVIPTLSACVVFSWAILGNVFREKSRVNISSYYVLLLFKIYSHMLVVIHCLKEVFYGFFFFHIVVMVVYGARINLT